MRSATVDLPTEARSIKVKQHLEANSFSRILASETEVDLLRAKDIIDQSLTRRPEAKGGPRWWVSACIRTEIGRRLRGMGALPPVKATYIGRKI